MRTFRSFYLVFICTGLIFKLNAQQHQHRWETLDVTHYKFEILISDLNDQIDANATINISFKKPVTSFTLDLVKHDADGKGMSVVNVLEDGKPIPYQHQKDQLKLTIGETSWGEIRNYQIKYGGIPADGLIISENKFGDRTFFGDNWPDRGKNWLPLVDHLSDKASVEWLITAPAHYQVIGNGVLIEKYNLDSGQILTHWKMDKPIPPKVMVFGAAEFAVKMEDNDNEIPISTWVFPQNKEEGFADFAIATEIMEYLVAQYGPYPFDKLANVQSKTRFGGMENAGNIFYHQNSVTGTGEIEGLIVHEMVHQWFGNSATEMNWHHLWLSEGFATYLTNLYFADKYGRETFLDRIQKDRELVIKYAKSNLEPLIDTEVKNYLKLLNPNSYQKGGWLLHMIRNRIGDRHFRQSLREYYNRFQYSNALSEDFEKVVEEVSGEDLSGFFQQWLYQVGHPVLSVSWKQDDRLKLTIAQEQSALFEFPLELKVSYTDGSTEFRTLNVSNKISSFNIPTSGRVKNIETDPDTRLLYEIDHIRPEE